MRPANSGPVPLKSVPLKPLDQENDMQFHRSHKIRLFVDNIKPLLNALICGIQNLSSNMRNSKDGSNKIRIMNEEICHKIFEILGKRFIYNYRESNISLFNKSKMIDSASIFLEKLKSNSKGSVN